MKNHQTDTTRVKSAIHRARTLLKAAGHHGQEDLTRALLLQGILSGDVISASIAERQRLQKENLRLHQRLTHAKLRTERARAIILEKASTVPTALLGLELVNRMREIYALPPLALPPAPVVEAEIVSPVSPETRSHPDPPDQSENTPPTTLRGI